MKKALVSFFCCLLVCLVPARATGAGTQKKQRLGCRSLLSWFYQKAQGMAQKYPEYDAEAGQMILSNEELLRLVGEYRATKSKAARDKFYAAHVTLIEKIIVSKFSNYKEPQELVGIATEALGDALDKFPLDVRNPQAYTWTTIENRIIDFFRKNARRRKKAEMLSLVDEAGKERPVPDSAPDASELMMSQDFMAAIQGFRKTLKPPQLQFFDDMMLNRVAEKDLDYAKMRGIPHATVRTYRFNIKRAFMKYLKDRQIDLAP